MTLYMDIDIVGSLNIGLDICLHSMVFCSPLEDFIVVVVHLLSTSCL